MSKTVNETRWLYQNPLTNDKGEYVFDRCEGCGVRYIYPSLNRFCGYDGTCVYTTTLAETNRSDD